MPGVQQGVYGANPVETNTVCELNWAPCFNKTWGGEHEVCV